MDHQPGEKKNTDGENIKEGETDLKIPMTMTPTHTSHHEPAKSMSLGPMQSEGVTPTNLLPHAPSPQFSGTPVQTTGLQAGFGSLQGDSSPEGHKVPTTTTSVAGSFGGYTVASPQPVTQETQVLIFVDDLLIASTEKDGEFKLDASVTKNTFSDLSHFCSPVLLVTSHELEVPAAKALAQVWGTLPPLTVKSVKEAIEDLKKGPSKLVISDELFFKQSPAVRTEALSTGCVILFASLFTKNENWVGIDYAKVATGRGSGNILSKLKHGHIRDRKMVGLFIEGSYYNLGLVKAFEDTENVSFVPVLFNDMPSVEFDFLFERISNFRAKVVLSGDKAGHAKKVYENFLKYEEKSKSCVIIDRSENSKAMMSRSEFMELLREHCEAENERLGKEVFEIPWTRSGDYLDVLNNPSTDSMITKLAGSIPFPLITKSDLACGAAHTHSFMIIKERPEDWSALKEKLEENYQRLPFIVQRYVSIDDNTVVKSAYFDGVYSYDIREGFNKVAESDHGKGNFLEQSTTSVKKQQKHDGTEHEGMDLDPEISRLVKEFTVTLADRMGCHLLGVDFLIQTTQDGAKICPVDLNKMPRPDKIVGFRDALLSQCNLKSSYIQLTPEE